MVLYGRVAKAVANEGLSPWSRDFVRRVSSDPELRERLAGPRRVDAVHPSFAGFAREADPRALDAPIFRPYRWVRLVWPPDADGRALAEHLRRTGLFDHVEPEPHATDRRVVWHQSATITDPLFTAVTNDPHRRQWAIDQARFKDAFHYTEGRVLIGVPDTGIRPDHPDLAAAQRPHQRAALVRYTLPGSASEESVGPTEGFFPQAFAPPGRPLARPLDGDLGGQSQQHWWNAGHGIHVAGLIAARKNNAEGGVGGCPGCDLAVLRFSDPAVLPTAWHALGPSFGSSVISMSFATNYFSELMLDTLVALQERDVALIASLGNDAVKANLAGFYGFPQRSAYPGYLPFVIGVGGTDVHGERWYEPKVMTRPLHQRHPQLWWDAVIDAPGRPLTMSGLGLSPPNAQWLPIGGWRSECGSNWGRELRTVGFVASYDTGIPGLGTVTVTLPAGEYGLDLMAPAAQVLAPLDREYSRREVQRSQGPVLEPFPCWFQIPDPINPTDPVCPLTGINYAPGTHRIANAGIPMGADDPIAGVSYSQIPRNEPALGYANYGTLTGTSMAAPLVAAAAGLARSVNPMLRAAAVHDLLRCTATPMSNSEVWSGDPVLNPNPTINATIRTQLTGAGRLNAEAVVRRTLGTVGGQTLRNRLIPMFSLTTWPEEPRQSWLFTTSPQVALAAMTGDLHRLTDPALPLPNDDQNLSPDPPYPATTGNPLPHGADSPQNDVGTAEGITYVSATVNAVGARLDGAWYAFPTELSGKAYHTPSASFLVFSTPFNPLTQQPNGLVPLHRMSMKCSQYRHHFYTTDPVERENAKNGPPACTSSSAFGTQGWYDDGIDGYVYHPNLAQPPGTIELRRGWLPSIGNWVLLTPQEEALRRFPGLTNVTRIGYVYPAVDYILQGGGAVLLDIDADGLPDPFEVLIGLNPNNSDSDGDGRPDGIELPFAAPGVSDPLVQDTVTPCVP